MHPGETNDDRTFTPVPDVRQCHAQVLRKNPRHASSFGLVKRDRRDGDDHGVVGKPDDQVLAASSIVRFAGNGHSVLRVQERVDLGAYEAPAPGRHAALREAHGQA